MSLGIEGSHFGGSSPGERESLPPPAPVPTYASVSKQMPKIGGQTVKSRDPEKTVLLYPAEGQDINSQATTKTVKAVLAPKTTGLQVRALRPVQKGCIVLETATRQGATKFKELAAKVPTLRLVTPR